MTPPVDTLAVERSGAKFRAVVESTKPGITKLVTITSLVGFLLAAISQPWAGFDLAIAIFACVAGTAASAAGANALNQYMERDRDARMPRTEGRPLPSGRLTPATVLWSGLGLTFVGVAILWALGGAAPAAVALATTLTYLLWYTPLKPRSSLSTWVGAIPGALPPLIGWSIARGQGGMEAGFASLLEVGGLSLFALMFVWQMPHFFAIGWMYREHYRMGGYKILPVVDQSGKLTPIVTLVCAIALIPATLAPALAMPETLGWASLALALITGLAYLWLCIRFVRERTDASAKRVFLASILHLPLLLLGMVLEAVVGAWL